MRRALATTLALVTLAGCGGGEDDGRDGDGSAAAYGPGGVSVEEARARGGTQLVRGSLLARAGEVRLCSMLAESFPPQCGEPSLVVEGLDLASVVGTTTAEGVTWSEREVRLHGAVDGDVLRVTGA